MNVYSNIHTSPISPENIVKNGRQSEKKKKIGIIFNITGAGFISFLKRTVFQHYNSNYSLLKISYFCCDAKNANELITLLLSEKMGD